MPIFVTPLFDENIFREGNEGLKPLRNQVAEAVLNSLFLISGPPPSQSTLEQNGLTGVKISWIGKVGKVSREFAKSKTAQSL